MTGLYLSKIPTILMAGFLCAQAAVAKLTPSGPELTGALGRLTSAYTVGGVIGLWLGERVDKDISALIAVIGCL